MNDVGVSGQLAEGILDGIHAIVNDKRLPPRIASHAPNRRLIFHHYDEERTPPAFTRLVPPEEPPAETIELTEHFRE